MALPELIYAPIDGGTIHRYEISGGKRKFLRFIGCYLGQCNFHKNIDDAIAVSYTHLTLPTILLV